jgi:hypothetical protein
MAKSRKARRNARDKRVAAKKSGAFVEQMSTATTTNHVLSTPNANPSSGYRMPSSSLFHAVETFEMPAPLGPDPWQHRLEPSTSSHVAELPALQPMLNHQEPSSYNHVAELLLPQPALHHHESPGPDQITEMLASVRSTAREIRALIESKKTTNSTSGTTAADVKSGRSVGPEVELSLKTIYPDRFLCRQPDFLDPNYAYNHVPGNTDFPQDHGLAPPPEEEDYETSDVEMVDACTLSPDIVVGDGEDAGSEPQEAEQDATPPTVSRHQSQARDDVSSNDNGSLHADSISETTPSSDQKPAQILADRPRLLQTALTVPTTPGASIMPVSPTFDLNRASPTSSQSSLTNTAEEENGADVDVENGRGRSGELYERNEFDRTHRQEGARARSTVSRHDRAVECLGPSIMFELFGGVLD